MSHSTFLVAEPSFLAGAGRVGDLWGSLAYFSYNYSHSPEEADARAIAHDWHQVGDDLESTMAKKLSE